MTQRHTSDCYYTNVYKFIAFIHVFAVKYAHMSNIFTGRKTMVIKKRYYRGVMHP